MLNGAGAVHVFLGTLIVMGMTLQPAHGAAFTATNEAELAQAILDANASPADDSIFLDTPDDVSTVITLTAPLPIISGNLVIAGKGEDVVRISGDGLFRVFYVRTGDVTFRNLTIGDGVSIGSNGGNSSSGGGGGSPGIAGGLYVNAGRTFLERVTIDNCHALGGNGGTIDHSGNGGGGGAGFDEPGFPSTGNVGGDGGDTLKYNSTPGAGGPEADGMNNPNGRAGQLGTGGGGGGGAIDPNMGGAGGSGGIRGGGGGGGAGSATRRGGNGGNGGFGAGGGGAGLNVGGGSGNPGRSAGLGGNGGRSANGFGNGGGGGAGLGGALFVGVNGTVATTNVMFSNNSATGGLGGLGGDGGETDDDGADGRGKGGAIYVAPGSILAFDGLLLFDNNMASDGGTGGLDNQNFAGSLVPLEGDASAGGGGGGGGCFIATAAYGTPVAADIDVLRAFRDEHMLDNAVGLFVADVYYSVSPHVADSVAEHPTLAALIRLVLVPVVAVVHAIASSAGPYLLGGVALLMFAAIARRRSLIGRG